MKKLHQRLVRNNPWYAKWHEYPSHSSVHYAALATVLLVVGIVFFSSKGATAISVRPAAPEALAQVNGARVLKKGEYAVLQTGLEKGKKALRSFVMKDGTSFTVKTTDMASISIIEGNSGATTIAPLGAVIHSAADFTGYDGVVDSAITRTLKNQEKVSVIVRFKGSGRYYNAADTASARTSKAQAFNKAKASIAASIGRNGRIKQELKIINGISVEVNAKALEAFQRNRNIAKVDLDREVSAVLDTSAAQINAPHVWSLIDSSGSPVTGIGTRIAVIDTGVDYTHPDLGGCLGANCKVIGGYDFVNNDADPMDDQGHGTHVAATAAGKGILSGIAPDAKILAYKVLNSSGSGSSSAIVAAIDRSTDPNQDGNPADHVDVANMSLGGGGNPDDAMSLAVDNSSAAGVIHAIAAGNSGPSASTIGSPGVARSAITVAASCKTEQIGSNCNTPIANFSSRGPLVWNSIDIKKPDIAAPGVFICAARWATSFAGSSTCFDANHIRISGTSMATPHIAGVAALMKQANPSFTPQQVKDRLKATARDLGSGLTYNDQGAGEVDLKIAIPISPKVTFNPTSWDLTTDPTKKMSLTTKSFSVTSIDSALDSLSFSFVSPVPGITFTPSKQTLSVPNRGTDTFTGTITVDNDLTPAGKYNTIVFLQSAGVNVGALFVTIVVAPTVTVSPAPLDYGVDNPSLVSWTSPSITATITNKRTDAAQTLSVSTSALPAGVTYTKNATSLDIPAGGSATLTTSVTVDNTILPNGTYNSSLILSNGTSQFATPVKFIKFYAVTLTGDTPWVVTLSSATSKSAFSFSSGAFPTTVYLNQPGSYTAQFSYPPTSEFNGGPDWYYIIKENVIIDGSVTLSSLKSEANNTISVVPTGISDGLGGQDRHTIFSGSPALSSFMTFTPSEAPILTRITNVSPAYKITTILESGEKTRPSVYAFGGEQIGITSNSTITNTLEQLKKMTVQHDLNKPSGTSIYPHIFMCANENSSCSSGSFTNILPKTPYSQTVYSVSLLPNVTHFPRVYGDMNFGPILADLGMFSASRAVRQSWPSTPMTIPIIGERLFNGLGPSVWFAGFRNNPGEVIIAKPTQVWTYHTPLSRQDFSFSAHAAIPFTLKQSGATVATGEFPAFGWGALGDLAVVPLPAGAYEFSASFPYQNRQISLAGEVKAMFDTSRADSNPPTITRMGFFGDAYKTDIYNAAATHRLETEIDPNGGSLSSVRVELSADGGAFADVPVTSTGGAYNANLPSVSIASKVALRLTATDNSDNTLQYTFELPKGTIVVPPPPPDTIAPTVSITAPAPGAIVKGSVPITAAASDDKGVANVIFYYLSNGVSQYITADNSSPYAVYWDTSRLRDGTYGIQALAEDTSANRTVSSTINVTVNNKTTGGKPPAGDTTAPTASITSPTSGASVSGIVPIAVTATDNVAVTSVTFYQGTLSLGSDTTAPYVLDWDTRNTANGTTSISARAYDAAGNSGNAPAVSVTVSNASQPPSGDTTPPTVYMTNPTDNSSIKVGTSITLQSSANDDVGVTIKEFYVGSTRVCSGGTTSICIWKLPNSPGKLYTITSKAYDAAGNVGTSAPVTIVSTSR